MVALRAVVECCSGSLVSTIDLEVRPDKRTAAGRAMEHDRSQKTGEGRMRRLGDVDPFAIEGVEEARCYEVEDG